MSQDYQITCPENMGIAMMDQLKDSFQTAIDAATDVRIDASEINKIDTAGCQLLLAFKQAVESNGKSFTWANVSEPLHRISKIIGLDSLLEFPKT